MGGEEIASIDDGVLAATAVDHYAPAAVLLRTDEHYLDSVVRVDDQLVLALHLASGCVGGTLMHGCAHIVRAKCTAPRRREGAGRVKASGYTYGLRRCTAGASAKPAMVVSFPAVLRCSTMATSL